MGDAHFIYINWCSMWLIDGYSLFNIVFKTYKKSGNHIITELRYIEKNLS